MKFESESSCSVASVAAAWPAATGGSLGPGRLFAAPLGNVLDPDDCSCTSGSGIDGATEFIVPIVIDVTVNGRRLFDRLLWDLNASSPDPVHFARLFCIDCALEFGFEEAIAACLARQLRHWQAACLRAHASLIAASGPADASGSVRTLHVAIPLDTTEFVYEDYVRWDIRGDGCQNARVFAATLAADLLLTSSQAVLVHHGLLTAIRRAQLLEPNVAWGSAAAAAAAESTAQGQPVFHESGSERRFGPLFLPSLVKQHEIDCGVEAAPVAHPESLLPASSLSWTRRHALAVRRQKEDRSSSGGSVVGPQSEPPLASESNARVEEKNLVTDRVLEAMAAAGQANRRDPVSFRFDCSPGGAFFSPAAPVCLAESRLYSATERAVLRAAGLLTSDNRLQLCNVVAAAENGVFTETPVDLSGTAFAQFAALRVGNIDSVNDDQSTDPRCLYSHAMSKLRLLRRYDGARPPPGLPACPYFEIGAGAVAMPGPSAAGGDHETKSHGYLVWDIPDDALGDVFHQGAQGQASGVLPFPSAGVDTVIPSLLGNLQQSKAPNSATDGVKSQFKGEGGVHAANIIMQPRRRQSSFSLGM